MTSGAKTYKEIELQARINEATPHQLIELLYEGLMLRLSHALECAKQHDKAQMDEEIVRSIDIIMGLHSSLSTEVDSDLPYKLSNLYEYMQRQLLRARIGNSVSIIDEMISLIEPLALGWQEIGDSPHAD